ncbi:MAG: thioredoxin-disulfide reductase [Deltaproteobacteria bacterium]|jgi:thioredoxin reductase (NADPH)|nr:thioredoxin-disulfide reductase [Deltaproteobacteria bacterium]
MTNYDLVIIGGGPAGLTAAIYGARTGLQTLVLEQAISGGQMRLTGDIENYPGYETISGATLSMALHEQAIKQGARLEISTVEKLEFKNDQHFVETADKTFLARSIIIASGSHRLNLDCPGADEFIGKGVSFCALCDSGFVRDEVVAVVGGGNSALEEAQYISRFASKVIIIHRRDEFRADKIIQEKARQNSKIEFMMDSEVVKIEGTDIISTIHVKNKVTGKMQFVTVGGIFVFVGNAPNTDFVPPKIKRSVGGWIETNEKLETNIPGIYAAGDVRNTDLRQIVSACADGARAAVNASRYLDILKLPPVKN